MSLTSRFKKDFKKESEVKTTQAEFLEKMGFEKKRKTPKYRNVPRRLAIALPCAGLATILLIPAAAFVLLSLHIEENEARMRANYSLMEIKKANEESFRSLNEIDYKLQDYKTCEVSEEYKENVNSFAYALSKGVDLRSESTVFSPLSAFITNDILSHAGDEEAQRIYASVLGDLDENEANYDSMLRTNFFVNDDGTTQIYNGAFFRNDLVVKEDYVNFLSSRKVEAFKADYRTDKGKIVDWANQRLGERLLTEEGLPTTDETNLFLLSLLYFKAKWGVPFVKDYTREDTFHPLDGSESIIPFMNHTISVYPKRSADRISPNQGLYVYDDYVSCYDYYSNYYTIQYLVPKELDKNIFDLLDGIDFLKEDPARYASIYNESNSQIITSVRLSVPKFTLTSSIDMDEPLKGTGLAPLFNRNAVPPHHVLGNAIDSPSEKLYGSYIEKAKQYASVSFDEDGTTVHSIYFQAAAGATSAAPYGSMMEIKLDQPFIYVIRDANGLPLFIGSYVK